MLNEKEFAKDLIGFIDDSVSMFHAVEKLKEVLNDNGFKELSLKERWNLDIEGKYYVSKNNSFLTAFRIGSKDISEEGFKIVGAHTDSPTFRIKPNPEINTKGGYLKLNTEVYGGPILNTWFDRPLSIAGRVTLKTDDALKPKEELINIDRSIVIIPNLAIHMNRNVNTGFEINPQEHTLPIISMINENFEKEDYLLKLIAEELDVNLDEILDFEIYLYVRESGELVGLNEEFISAGKLDDLAMVHAGVYGLINSKGNKSVDMFVAFDNEEVGSETKQGAGSPTLKNIMKRISIALNLDEEDYYRALENSFMISADMAHAVHPNFLSKSDITNLPKINGGPAIKIATNQAYTTDSNSSSIYKAICKKAGIPYQIFVNRSDLRGGSTIGPISSSQLAITSIDIGNPVLAMHSVRELGGVKDHYFVYKSFLEFFNI